MNFLPAKVNNGFRIHLAFGNPEKGDTLGGVSEATEMVLMTSSDLPQSSYVDFNPQFEPNFGIMTGYLRSDYQIRAETDIIASDANPVPNQQIAYNTTLMVNVDNLPHKSYIGKGYKPDMLLTDTPVGNLQGLTKMIGKVPRHHDGATAQTGKDSEGPFYFDYFPYSIPLRNATELIFNELDISIRNPDGTLATDVSEAHLLLNITGDENTGEGSMGGSIGKPIEAPNSYDRLNVPKGQLQPEISGGFAQSKGSHNPQPARHERADKANDLDPMSHL